MTDRLGVDASDPFILRLHGAGWPRPTSAWEAEAWRRVMMNGIGAPEATVLAVAR